MGIIKKMFANKAGGYIAGYHLEEWWQNNFTEQEKIYINKKYEPMGESKGMLTKGSPIVMNTNVSMFLINLASWFSTKADIEIARKMIIEAERRYTNLPIIDLHFYYMQLIKFYYLDRENKESFEKAILACEKQISISEQARNAFISKHGSLPSHTGFKQLAIIEEKRKNYERALVLSKRAKKEGWIDEWDKRIKRLEKKIK